MSDRITTVMPYYGNMRVDGNISDLFFNTNLRDAVVYDCGTFSHYDEAKLREEAEMFLASLDRLGVAVPTVEALIADFYSRI